MVANCALRKITNAVTVRLINAVKTSSTKCVCVPMFSPWRECDSKRAHLLNTQHSLHKQIQETSSWYFFFFFTEANFTSGMQQEGEMLFVDTF
jgi:hypothetical protein